MKNKLFIILLSLLMATLVSGMNGGCGEPISESVSYGSPNWMTDGRIVANKTVVRERQKGIIPGYMTYETILRAAYIVTIKDDGTDEKVIYGGEDKWGKMSGVVASPLGNYLAYGSGQDINIIAADGTREVKTISCGETVNSFDWSPDETRIVYAGNTTKGMYILRISDEVKTQIATSAESVTWRVGEKIAYEYVVGSNPIKITTITSDGLTVNQLKTGVMPQLTSSQNIIFRSGGALKLMNTTGSNEVTLASSYDMSSLKLSFDNTKVVGADQGGIWLINIDGTGLKKIK